jgi:predicted ATPase/DNA-binding SARP family transcriptional activator
VRHTGPDGQGEADGDDPVRTDVRLLGPVTLLVDGGEVALSAPARDLLAVLALRVGERLDSDQVGTALWAVPPQRDANGGRIEAAADALAAALRRARVAGVLVRGADDLVLRLPGRVVDVGHFTVLLRRARERMADGQLAAAADLFLAALRRWRVDLDGDPLDGCALNPDGWAAAERTRLVQMRAGAVEDRWECVLRLAAEALTAAGAPAADRAATAAGAAVPGIAADAVQDLERALARHPLRERLWELLLTATAFGRGRRAAAEVHARAVATFSDGVGVAPGRRLAELAELARAGGLAEWWASAAPADGPASTEAAGTSAADVVARGGRAVAAAARASLPVPLTPLIGREQLLTRVAARLRAHRLVTLTGPGGSGKTRLAIATATRLTADPHPGAPPPPETGHHLTGSRTVGTAIDEAPPAGAPPAVPAGGPIAGATESAGNGWAGAGPADTGPVGAARNGWAGAGGFRNGATSRNGGAHALPGRPDTGPAWFVDLSSVESPTRVPEAVAAALGVRDEPGRDVVDTLADEIGAGATLLVLDNCEHLVPGCVELAGRLLRRCPRLRILATSRIALRLPEEATVAVPPLVVPRPGGAHTLDELSAHPASRLFLERARARSGRPLGDDDAGAVARLCAELDGLPLAIELAAARTPMLTVAEIVDRLRADLTLLRSPDPTAPARHRTVAAAVESSVDQLDAGARGLFDRLAVFAGGFDAEAALAVGGAGPPARLSALVEASLVEALPAADAGEPAPRFRMLVPIRRHALSRLAAGGGEEPARRAHARYFLGLAERADAELRGAAQAHWLARLRGDAANLRAAMDWLAGAGAATDAYGDLRLAAALANYCRLEGHYRDGRAWLAAALGRHPDAAAPLRARAGAGAAMLAMLLCDYDAAAEHAENARLACRTAGDRLGEARVEVTLGSVARERGDYRASSAHLDTAAYLFAANGDDWGEAHVALLRGFTAWLAGDLERAQSRLRSSLRRFEQLADQESVATALMNLGAVAFYAGDPDRAASLLDTALERFAAQGFPEGVGWAHNLRGLVELRAGRTDRAAAHFALSLAVHRQVGDRWRTASVLEALAEVARLDGDPVRGASLLGAAAWIRAEIGTPVPACEGRDLAATAAGLRAGLGDEAYDTAHRRGQVANLDAVLTAPATVAAAPH